MLERCLTKHGDRYLFIEVEAYSNALPPHDARVPKIPSDGVLSSAMMADRRRFCNERRSSKSYCVPLSRRQCWTRIPESATYAEQHD